MIELPDNAELRALARRTVWFKRPEEALSMPVHFVAHVLTFGTHADVRVLRRYVRDDELRVALDAAPAGVFDDRSWAYWNLLLGRDPPPALPVRTLEAGR
jgi:hypothetical protein